MLKENNVIIADSTKCGEIMNNFFSVAVVNLDIDRTLYTNNVEKIYDPISKSIIKYKNHPNIVKINEYIIIDSYFNFIPVLIEDLTEVVSHMGISKASQTNDIPPKMLKENFDICSYFLLTNVNNCILEAEFPDNLKLAIFVIKCKRENDE